MNVISAYLALALMGPGHRGTFGQKNDTLRSNLFQLLTSAMLDWSTCLSVERSPSKVSGSWVFVGSRVPVSALFQNLENGATVDDFLDWFPGVTRKQVESVLEFTEKSLTVDQAA